MSINLSTRLYNLTSQKSISLVVNLLSSRERKVTYLALKELSQQRLQAVCSEFCNSRTNRQERKKRHYVPPQQSGCPQTIFRLVILAHVSRLITPGHTEPLEHLPTFELSTSFPVGLILSYREIYCCFQNSSSIVSFLEPN